MAAGGCSGEEGRRDGHDLAGFGEGPLAAYGLAIRVSWSGVVSRRGPSGDRMEVVGQLTDRIDNTTEDHMGPATAVTCWQNMQTPTPDCTEPSYGTPAKRSATAACSPMTWRHPCSQPVAWRDELMERAFVSPSRLWR